MKKIVLLLVISLFLITGCGSKTAITAEDFKGTLEQDYEIYNLLENDQYEYLEGNYTIYFGEELLSRLDFYQLSDLEHAVYFYQENQKTVSDNQSDSVSEKEQSGDNYKKYTLETADTYYVVEYVDKTALYAEVDLEYKEELNNILDELGY